jgi:hypothetical protein
MGAPKKKAYKRSWKNYLLNARYQLRFTLFMVAICALLMSGLGWYVMGAAENSTTVAMDNIRGVTCTEPDLSALKTRPQVIIENEPAPDADKPAPEGDKPAPEGDKPAPEGDKPAPEARARGRDR